MIIVRFLALNMGKFKGENWRKKNVMRSRLRRKGYVRKMVKDAVLCGYCKKPFSDEDGMFKTMEHIIPLCLGGSNKEENVKVVCSLCNSEKDKEMNLEMAKNPHDNRWKEKENCGFLKESRKEFLKRCWGE